MKKICISENCEEEGKPNLELKLKSTPTLYLFSCKKHLRAEIRISKELGFSVKQSLNHICSLILCKECLDRVEEILDY